MNYLETITNDADQDDEIPIWGELTIEETDEGGKIYSGYVIYPTDPDLHFVSYRNAYNNGFDAEARLGHKKGRVEFSLYYVNSGERDETIIPELGLPVEALGAISDMLIDIDIDISDMQLPETLTAYEQAYTPPGLQAWRS